MYNFVLRDTQVLDDVVDYVLFGEFTEDEAKQFDYPLVAPTMWVTFKPDDNTLAFMLCDEGVPVQSLITEQETEAIKRYLTLTIPAWREWKPGQTAPETPYTFELGHETAEYLDGKEGFESQYVWGLFDRQKRIWLVEAELSYDEALATLETLVIERGNVAANG